MEPIDLRRRPPRSCYAELDGLLLLPRTIDKLRAQLPGGHPGEYVINLNENVRGISGYLFERLGISQDEMLEAVRIAETEDGVAMWLRERTDASAYPQINASLRRIRPKHSDDEAVFRSIYATTLELHPELEFVMDIVDADDRRMFPDPV